MGDLDTFETPRLTLRPFRPADAPPLYEIEGDEEAMRFTYRARSLEECAARLQTYEEARARLGFAPWVVIHRGDHRVIGWGGLNVDPFDSGWGVEVSYFFHPAYWGRGFATELVRMSLDHGFEKLSLPRIDAFAMPANTRSIRVLEKCGFAFSSYEPRLGRNRYSAERGVSRKRGEITVYDTIGQGYARQRRPDPRIAAQITAALGDARSLLNVGAGAGSYEPLDRRVVGVEPSTVMLVQRPRDAAPAVQAFAEALPFADRAFDAVMAVLTLHHWTDRAGGLAECARVARQRVVLLTWDPMAEAFWLVREYLPAFAEADRRQFPEMAAYADAFGPGARVEVAAVPVPRDCVDGFLGAYWARPAAYLDPAVRAGISSFALPDTEDGLERLRNDLASGAWNARHAHLLGIDQLDLGYRLVVAELSE